MNYNSADMLTLFQGFNATDWDNFGAGITTNGLYNTIAAHVAVASVWQSSLNWIQSNDPEMVTDYAAKCHSCATALRAGLSLDLGYDVTDNNAGLFGLGKIKISFNITWNTLLNPTVRSFSITHING